MTKEYGKIREEIAKTIGQFILRANFPGAILRIQDAAFRSTDFILSKLFQISQFIEKEKQKAREEYRTELINWMHQEQKEHGGKTLGDAFERVLIHLMQHKDLT